MGWFNNLFNRRVKPEQVIVSEPANDLPPQDAYVELKRITVNSDGATQGMAQKQPISKIKRINPQVLTYANSTYRAVENGYLAPEYDLAEVGVVEDVESFVRQATYKKVALMNKEGFDFVGKNPRTVQYIETRLAQIARASNISINQLLRNIGSNLMRMSNAFLIKRRDTAASGGKVRKIPGGKTVKPVAAYFPVAPETMRVKIGEQGQVLGWRQQMPDGRIKDYRKEDVCHFHIRRKDGFVFGTPDLVPVLDDIRALRNIEETIELLLHKHLFPLFQYIVGTDEQPAGVTEDGKDEIEVMKQEIQYMPAEGGIVTPERHKIEAIGAEGRALRGEGYLTYFKLRVIAGLGISEMDLGVGDTANRGTARVLSRQLIDTVKDIQDTVEEQFFNEIISELLLESTFSFDVLDAKDVVKLQYREIDLENRIELEKHVAEMFEANGLTYPEFRMALGKEPIDVPEDPDDQDPKKYPEWFQTHFKLFHEPETIIRAIDEAWTVQAKAAAAARSTSLTQGDLVTSQKEQEQKEKRAAEEDRKTKIAIAKAKPKPTSTKNAIEDTLRPASSYRELQKEIVEYVRSVIQEGHLPDSLLAMQNIQASLTLWANTYAEQLSSAASVNFIQAFNRVTNNQAAHAFVSINVARNEITDRCTHYLNKLASDLFESIDKLLKEEELTTIQAVAAIRSIFAAYKYRIHFISSTEVKKAQSYGMLLGRQYAGFSQFESVSNNEDTCERCLAMTGKTFHPNEFDLDTITPYHPGCQCEILPVKEEE